ncbi:MAG: hypothetical protein O7G85_10905 [Planctomycetota bacterium]|nr:hypothetical protein [Planctomycetota bacterium]
MGFVCPTCEYDLTGLIEQRCPECGEPFDLERLEREQAARKPFPDPHGAWSLGLFFLGNCVLPLFLFTGCRCGGYSTTNDLIRWLPGIVVAASGFGLALRGTRLGPKKNRFGSMIGLLLHGLWILIMALTFSEGRI